MDMVACDRNNSSSNNNKGGGGGGGGAADKKKSGGGGAVLKDDKLPRAGEMMAGLARQSQTLAVFIGLEDAPDEDEPGRCACLCFFVCIIFRNMKSLSEVQGMEGSCM